MELTRILHPVGQGGFYSETFKYGSDEINVIFDCGGNNKTSMEYYLENYYPKKTKTIDAVFISHFHDDHINGLKYLLDKYEVKNLFLPQLTSDEQLEVLLYNGLMNTNSTSGVNSFLYELLASDSFYGKTKIVSVSHSNGDDYASDEAIEDRDLDIVKEIGVNSIKSGTKIYFGEKWLFIPYNPPIITKKDQGFYEYFKEQLKIDDFDYKKLPDIVKNEGAKRCKEIYDDYFEGNHNAYSMTLFSGIARHHLYFRHCDYCYEEMEYNYHHFRHCRNWEGWNKFKNMYNCSPNCLYTGDFDTKNQLLNMKSFYKPFWETITSIQVPHHGSRNYFDSQLYVYANRGFISVGERNRYHHPSVDTLQGIQGMRCRPIIVTDSLSSIKLYHYNI